MLKYLQWAFYTLIIHLVMYILNTGTFVAMSITFLKSLPLSTNSIVEPGNVIKHPGKGRTHPDQITVADLTGLLYRISRLQNW